jgi:hypothetical protein
VQELRGKDKNGKSFGLSQKERLNRGNLKRGEKMVLGIEGIGFIGGIGFLYRL